MSNARRALPLPPEPEPHASWSSANLTAVTIDRDHEAFAKFQRFAWRREPQIRLPLVLGLASLGVPLLGPIAWLAADIELAEIEEGLVSRRRRGWLVLAKICGVIASCALATGIGVGVAYVTA